MAQSNAPITLCSQKKHVGIVAASFRLAQIVAGPEAPLVAPEHHACVLKAFLFQMPSRNTAAREAQFMEADLNSTYHIPYYLVFQLTNARQPYPAFFFFGLVFL